VAVVQLLISRSLPSNGSTCHNILQHKIPVVLSCEQIDGGTHLNMQFAPVSKLHTLLPRCGTRIISIIRLLICLRLSLLYQLQRLFTLTNLEAEAWLLSRTEENYDRPDRVSILKPIVIDIWAAEQDRGMLATRLMHVVWAEGIF
jgi:hypothetical protein